MSAADTDLVARVDRHFDTLLLGADAPDDEIDPELTAVLRHVHRLASRPAPDALFVRVLKAKLVGGDIPYPSPAPSALSHPNPSPSALGAGRFSDRAQLFPRPWWRRLEIAAALLVFAVLAGYLAVADQGRQGTEPPRLAGIEVPPAAISSEPVWLKIDAIGVNAPIERREADVEPVLIPAASDPWVVAWRADSAAPGEGSNVVLEGHLDYWINGPAVFWDLAELTEGDRVDVTGANPMVFSYTVEWLRRYPLADASEAQQREILGATPAESVTLITAAGEYDRATGLYPEVLVVRAQFDSVSSPLPILDVPDPAECRVAPRTIAELDAGAATVVARTDEVLELVNPPAFVTFADESASFEVRAAVIAAERTLVACLNARDALRTYALYTDDGLVRLLDYLSRDLGDLYEWSPDFSELALPATPMPESERLALAAVDDVRLLADGRVMATVTIGAVTMGRGPSESFGVPTRVPVTHIFTVERGDRYLIDEFVVTGRGTPTP